MRRRWRTIGLAAAAVAVAALALVQAGAAGPRSLGAFFFGPRLVRAEVVLAGAGGRLHDYRIDRGRVTAVGLSSLTLRERDGTSVTVPVAPAADVRVGGRAVTLLRLQLRLGLGATLVATTIRDGDGPAQTVEIARSP